MNARQVFTVYAKELTDTLRDRRTLMSMFVVPTLLIPVIFSPSARSRRRSCARHAPKPRQSW